jgi:alpha-beta hydrolase superfamily lysophospholipase
MRRVGAVLALLLFGGSLEAAVSRPVALRSEDGVALAATFYEAPRQPAPAVILLHMQTRSREDWQAFAHRLADSGIHALAIDFRGHGGSGAGPAGDDGQPNLSRLVLDVQAARAYLAGRPEAVRGSAIGLLGASIGANVAILQASADTSIRSLALLSPGLDYRSLRTEAALRKYGSRPALLVAAGDDPYALRSVRELAKAGEGLREVRTLGPAGHGTVMLSRDADLERALVDWFQRTLL